MDYKELLEQLDASSDYMLDDFEQYAFLMESDEEIETDALVQVLKQFNRDILLELNNNYFSEILRILPEEEVSLYAHMEAIKRHFAGMIEEEDLNEAYRLSESIYAFREWYSSDENCYLMENDNWTGYSLRDGVTQRLLDEIEGFDREYKFDEYEDFPMDEYFVDLFTMRDEVYDDYDGDIEEVEE